MDTKLKKYNQKRNFEKTKEPQGLNQIDSNFLKKDSLRFVVQHHLARKDHYDLRLEWNDVLLSWAVPKGPSYNPHDKRLAIQVEDHPLDYINFEGTIPKGEYGGGIVMLWDEGYYKPEYDVDKGLKKGELKFVLNGKRLNGKWALIRLKEDKGKQENWLLLKEKDKFVKNDNGIDKYITSIKTARTMIEIEKGEDKKFIKNPINNVDVQLCKLVKIPYESEEWLYEVKYDGYRILTYIEEGNVKLITRNGNDFTHRFKNIAFTLSQWSDNRAIILDGEVVVVDEKGRTDFQALQNYMKNPKGKSLTYMIFDIIALEGKDLRDTQLIKRKEILKELLKDAPKNLCCSNYVRGRGKECLNAACKLNLEGIVGKKVDSIYSGKRNGDWIKIKCEKRQEFVVGGYTISNKRTSGISSLLLGAYEINDLIFTGRVGTGFTENTLKELEVKFKTIKTIESPFKQMPKSNKNEKTIWLKPIMVAEVKFADWTEENLLRHASFKGIRLDKSPKTIKIKKMENLDNMIKEQINTKNLKDLKSKDNEIYICGIKITNPKKILYEESKISKEDVALYYEKVSEFMMPYLGNRILSVIRYPKGISAPSFFKKHINSINKGIVKIPIKNNKEDFFYINNSLGIISQVQMNTLEFHTWGSRIETIEKPDMMIFDLDPDEEMDLKQIRRGVKDLKSILDKLSLKSYLKTSGGKGYHIVIPFKPSVNWDVFHDFAKHIAEVLEKKWPDRYTINSRKNKRKDKIFIDWARNGKGATSIAPYSLRGRKGAPVSMPINWNELDTVAPNGVNMEEALKRIKGKDPWKDFYKTEQQLIYK